MNQYKIYCTPTQTKKALELGAPLKTFIHVEPEFSMANGCLPYPEEIEMYEYPTAEQMIGWLEEQLGENSSVYMVQDSQCWWSANVYDSCNYKIFHNNDYHSRKEATLAAIDAALEYLSNKK